MPGSTPVGPAIDRAIGSAVCLAIGSVHLAVGSPVGPALGCQSDRAPPGRLPPPGGRPVLQARRPAASFPGWSGPESGPESGQRAGQCAVVTRSATRIMSGIGLITHQISTFVRSPATWRAAKTNSGHDLHHLRTPLLGTFTTMIAYQSGTGAPLTCAILVGKPGPMMLDTARPVQT